MPSFGRHGIRYIVDIQRLAREGHHTDQGLTDDLQLLAQDVRTADMLRDAFRGADNLVAGVDVAVLADRHHARPAACDEGAGAGSSHVGGCVDAAAPVGGDKVLVFAEGGVAVEDGAVALWREAVFVRVAGDGGDALDAEVEGFGFVAGAGEEGDEKGAEAAVHMEADVAFGGEAAQGGYVVDDAVGEVGCRAYEEDGVCVYEAGHMG